MHRNLLLANPATTNEKLYVEDVFSTYLYSGTDATQIISNGIALGNGAANKTTLHLTGDTLTDSSPVPCTLSNLSVTVNTSTKKYGTGSLYFSGSSTKINVTPTASVAILSSDCTIECWVYPTALSNEGIWGFSDASTGDCYLQWFGNALYVKFGNIYTSVAATSASMLNTWTHLAVVRYNNAVTLFINGVGTNLGTVTTNPIAQTYFTVGDACFNNIINFDGYIDDLRVSQRAVYTANFTPPTAALPLDTLVSGNGGLVWLKSRSGTVVTGYDKHILFDTARTNTTSLSTNLTSAVEAGWGSLFRFRADGFDFGTSTSTTDQSYANNLGVSYVSWTFRKAAKFFDCVTWTGNGSNRTISHALGVVPGMIIIKRTNSTSNWAVYHRSIANTQYLATNTTAASATDATYWNSTTPTATEFSIGTSAVVNASGGTYVAYLFAHDTTADGIVQCGSANCASGAVDVNLGWEPQYILFKAASSSENWFVYDTMRGVTVSGTGQYISPNSSGAEGTYYGWIYLTNNGFKLNGNPHNYVWMAIRRGPMRTPTDATKVFSPITSSSAAGTAQTTSFPIDLQMANYRAGDQANTTFSDRLRGVSTNSTDTFAFIRSASTAAEGTSAASGGGSTRNWNNTGFSISAYWGGASTMYWNFRRAPGFFDVVCYTGTGSARTVSHNLGVAPELMIIKSRSDGVRNWSVYSASLGTSFYLNLNDTTAQNSTTTGIYWNNTTPTASVFSLGNGLAVNTSGATYVAYLFASCPGVSKVGSYTGSGTTKQIDCGFTSGARLVLIKRTDTTGDWYIYDTARGIVAGNDPYLLLNSTAAEVTNTDYVDAYSAGFELSSTAPAGLNEASGITWVSRTSGFETTAIRAVTYGNGLYVAVGDSGTLTTSTDGTTWTSRTSGFAGMIRDVAYGNGIYVAVGSSGTLTTSPDGITWTSRTSGFGLSNINDVTYGNGIFVIAGDLGKISTSPDGITWTSRTSGFVDNIFSVVFGNDLFLAGGSAGILITSPDGTTWTSRTSGFGTATINSITYGNSLYVAVGTSGTLTTSTNGTTWTSRTSGFGANTITDVSYGNGTFVAVGSSGTMTTSTNGTTWTSRTSGFGTTAILAVAYGNGMFVAGGSSGTMTTNNPSYIYLAIA